MSKPFEVFEVFDEDCMAYAMYFGFTDNDAAKACHCRKCLRWDFTQAFDAAFDGHYAGPGQGFSDPVEFRVFPWVGIVATQRGGLDV